MSDPALWQPGTIVVNRDGTEVAELLIRTLHGFTCRTLDGFAGMSDAELAESWHPLADVVARGWEQRQEVPVRWCLAHEDIASDPNEDRCDDAARAHLAPACPLTPALSYPITEGNEP